MPKLCVARSRWTWAAWPTGETSPGPCHAVRTTTLSILYDADYNVTSPLPNPRPRRRPVREEESHPRRRRSEGLQLRSLLDARAAQGRQPAPTDRGLGAVGQGPRRAPRHDPDAEGPW